MPYLKNLKPLWLPAVVAVFFYLGVKGIGWGLPGKARSDIVLPQELRNAGFYDLMIKKRNDIYALTEQSSTGRMAEKNDKGVTAVMKNLGIARDRVYVFNKEPGTLADFVRPYLLRSNHPDEQMTLAALSNMKPAKLDFNPRLFQYGGAYIYPVGAWLGALKISGLIFLTGDLERYFESPGEMAKIFVAGRAFSLLCGLASLILVYFMTLKHFGARTAAIAALFFSVMPGIVFQMHVMKPYTLSMFFSLAALYYSFEICDDPGGAANYFLSGMFSGLAIGSMPSYGLIIIAPAAVFVTAKEKSAKNALIFIAAAAAFFILTNPYWILDYKSLSAELHGFSSGKASLQLPAFIFFLTRQIPEGTGIVFMIAAACGIMIAMMRAGKKEVILAVSVVLPVLLVSFLFKYLEFSVQTVRLVLPWIAMSCILSGSFIDFLFEKAKMKWLGYCLLAMILLELFGHSYICAENFRLDAGNDSTRLMAGRWIEGNIPPGSRVGLYGLPEPFNVPPMDFRNYRVSILFDTSSFDGLDYFICTPESRIPPDDSRLMLVEDFRPRDSFMGMKYSMGLTSLNSEVFVFKVNPLRDSAR